jgi:8-oxo-dGTP diphosphatase
MERANSSTVSVDVLTLRHNHVRRQVEIAVAPRTSEPYLGQLALPGVVLREGERLAAAAERAASEKLGLPLLAQGQLAVFDDPQRDPRGATLSIAMWAIADRVDADPTQWFTLDDLPPLGFDHSLIVATCRPLFVELLWRDLAFTRALTGPTFPVSAAVAITRSLTGSAPDRGNLNRRLAAVKGLGVSNHKVVLGRGRPGTLWEWLPTAH